ncbi:ribosomal protein-like protein S15 [Pleomassaria siparia CBS 279.74]|uniref:Ribosomal protein-like protein S15 n=1 Tax=Pleomassaria siparia CBS 279.74 TaxID=1314801 RepID=A0A6G1JVQ1_9PLEO|nr:ribosomal protein-like protein S15 [Pleomassaria siparia CBS 279.74]
MPPRIPVLACLRASKAAAPLQFTLPFRPFSSTPVVQGKKHGRPIKHISQDPYLVAMRNRKKAANLSRRGELEQQRVDSLGDPVRGTVTPFVESFETGIPLEPTADIKTPKEEFHLNYALKPKDVEASLAISEKLAVPRSMKKPPGAEYTWKPINYAADPDELKKFEQEKLKDHQRATEAIARITALENGSSKDRMRVNITRCVSTFGRHNTDRIFPPRAPPLSHPKSPVPHAVRPETNIEATMKRIGPDTGSSEVQIAILTAKIKTLADFLETRGKGDKHNKRNLRLLVHRRQKLLKYLRRKERGGPRWQHCIEMLGLTEGTWKNEISL